MGLSLESSTPILKPYPQPLPSISIHIIETQFEPELNLLNLNLEVKIKVWGLPELNLEVRVWVLAKMAQTWTGLDCGQSRGVSVIVLVNLLACSMKKRGKRFIF
jgi:hypothetical protein